MSGDLEITQRELAEIKHTLYYAAHCNHGTANHNLLMLVAKLAADKGFRLSLDKTHVIAPVGVTVTT